jgi:hypothetical protein
MDIFTKLPEINTYHSKFEFLTTKSMLRERSILNEWVEGFEDRDNKIIKEFQTTFHSSFWEFYLFSIFKNLGFSIDFSKNRPDFIIEGQKGFYVEAVVSNIKNCGNSESSRTFDDILDMLTAPHLHKTFKQDLYESVTRHSNAIQSKFTKYRDKYLKLPWVDAKKPFVIALSAYDQINYGREFYYSMFALLYGFVFDETSNSFDKKNTIMKPGTKSDIPIGLFLDPYYSEISAIIFSCTLSHGKLTSLANSKNDEHTWNTVINLRHDNDKPHYKFQIVSNSSPESLFDGLFVFHNPNANSKLDMDIFNNTDIAQVTFYNNAIKVESSNLPIVARINIPSMFLPGNTLENFLIENFLKNNPEENEAEN